jgi:hypothetical protein
MADDDPDPNLCVNCPTCGAVLAFAATRLDVHLYTCAKDGLFTLTDSDPDPRPLPQ